MAQSNSTHSEKPKLSKIGVVTKCICDCCVLGFAGALQLHARLSGHLEISVESSSVQILQKSFR